jgi:membrane-bound inhibitor of C-type lysozyme
LQPIAALAAPQSARFVPPPETRMKKTALGAAVFAATLLAGSIAVAQTAPAKPAKPAPAAAKAPAAKPLPAADQDQLQAAQRTLTGQYACEFDQKIDVEASPRAAGYVDVKYKNSVFTMKPVLSSTGALRLEDVTGRTLLLQIANKSMLMDTKIGQRLVDNCVHPEQAKFNTARAS